MVVVVFCCAGRCEEDREEGEDGDGSEDWDEGVWEEEGVGELQTVLQPGVLGSMFEGMAKVAEGSKSSSSSLSWVEMPSSTSRIIASI